MAKYLFLILLFAFGQNEIVAQTRQVDSLRMLSEKYEGQKKVDALNEYAEAVSSYHYSNSVGIAQDAYELAKELNYTKGEAQALILQGVIDMKTGLESEARAKFQKSIGLSIIAKDEKLQANALTHIGISHQNIDQLDSAEGYYARAYQLLKDSANPAYLSFLYRALGKLNELKNDPATQVRYLNKSWAIGRKLENKKPLVYTGRDLAVFYTEQGSYEKSLSILKEIQRVLGSDTIANEEISMIYKERAIIFADMGDYRAALRIFEKVKKFYEQNVSQLELVNLFTDMGHVLSYSSNNFETSLKYFFRAIQLAEANHFLREATLLYARVGWVYYLMEQDGLAEEFSLKALRSSKGRYFSEEGSAMNMLGLVYTRNHQEKKALDYFNKAVAIREKYNYRAGLASTLLNVGILYEKMGDFKRAEEYDLKSLQLEMELNNASDLSYSYQSLGQLYIKLKRFDIAETYLNKAEVLSKKIKAQDILKDTYRNKRDLFQAQSNYTKAFHYSILYESVHDSLFNQNLSNRISSMQYDFELDQKDKEIKILNQQQKLQQTELELQQAEIKQQRYIIMIGLVIVLNIIIAAIIVFRFYRKVRKLNREISEQNEEITVQSEELRETNELLHNLNREINEQKEEIEAQSEELIESNETISRVNARLEEKVEVRTTELKQAYTELDTFFYRSSHDFRRPLTTFMGLAEVAKITVKDNVALELFEKINETARNLDKMLMKLQSVSTAGGQDLIYSDVLIEQIIQIELDNFRQDIIQKSIQVFTEINLVHPFVSYPVLIKFIIQNLIENSIAFSNTQSPFIKIRVYESAGETIIDVSDNGQGIDPAYLNRVFEMYFRANEKSKGNGLGLYIVKKMTDKLNGRVELISEKGVGTTVRTYLPNHYK